MIAERIGKKKAFPGQFVKKGRPKLSVKLSVYDIWLIDSTWMQMMSGCGLPVPGMLSGVRNAHSRPKSGVFLWFRISITVNATRPCD